MKIISAEIQQTIDYVQVNVKHDNKEFDVEVEMMDGRVMGDYNSGLKTSHLRYLYLSDSIRKRHFKEIKKYVEENV